jgi:anthranilate/para-aminobenzoate synthase component II
MHDWNHNGRMDAMDSFIDYQVFQEVAKSNEPELSAMEDTEADDLDLFETEDTESVVPGPPAPQQTNGCAFIIYGVLIFVALLIYLSIRFG